jgi:hypothetical protein
MRRGSVAARRMATRRMSSRRMSSRRMTTRRMYFLVRIAEEADLHT